MPETGNHRTESIRGAPSRVHGRHDAGTRTIALAGAFDLAAAHTLDHALEAPIR